MRKKVTVHISMILITYMLSKGSIMKSKISLSSRFNNRSDVVM